MEGLVGGTEARKTFPPFTRRLQLHSYATAIQPTLAWPQVYYTHSTLLVDAHDHETGYVSCLLDDVCRAPQEKPRLSSCIEHWGILSDLYFRDRLLPGTTSKSDGKRHHRWWADRRWMERNRDRFGSIPKCQRLCFKYNNLASCLTELRKKSLTGNLRVSMRRTDPVHGSSRDNHFASLAWSGRLITGGPFGKL